MKLNCPKCAAETPAENRNLDQRVARCPNCNYVFNFSKDEFGDWGRVKRKRFKMRHLGGIKVQRGRNTLTIRLSWFNLTVPILTLFAIPWNIIMVAAIVQSIAEPGLDALSLVPLALFGSFASIYCVVAGYINETQMMVSDGRLTVRYAPLPFWGNKDIATDDIIQLYTVYQFQSRRYRGGRYKSYGIYELHVVLGNNRNEKLLSGLFLDPDQTALVEQEVEKFLGLKDRVMWGEYDGT